MNYYIKYDPSINPRSFTACSGTKCNTVTCQRNLHNHTQENIFSIANLYIDCDSYLTETDVDSKDNL